ncbi:MAG TPA: S8 family serine peptidase [Bacteroidia bacterium]|nr:S8 family serine peptidase [Bacteroidia bacterium]
MIKLAPALLLFFTAIIQQAAGQTLDSNYLDGEIYVKYRDDFPVDFSREFAEPQALPGLDVNKVNEYGIVKARFSFNKTTSIKLQKTVRLKFIQVNKINELVEYFSGLQFVEYAEKIPAVYPTYTPNDLGTNSVTNQWHLYKIKAREAWDYSKGDTNIKVAVVDQEFDINHPDLINNVWTNHAEIPNNGVDDDFNGYVDDIHGWDVADNDNNVICNTNPNLNHGTPCVGLVAATTDNNNGISAIGYNVKFLPIKVCYNGQSTKVSGFAYEGITKAADFGADVISCSFGSSNFSQTNQSVIDYANSKKCIVVASAGNDNVQTAHYPAGYNNVIAVAASDINDSKASFSNYGSWIDVSSPGVECKTTNQEYSYVSFSGTSAACPLAAGLLGLMKSHYPQISNDDLLKCFINSTDNIDNLNSTHQWLLGTGRINAEKSMKCIDSVKKAPPKIFISDGGYYCPGRIIQLTATSLNKNLDSIRWIAPGANYIDKNGFSVQLSYNKDSIYDIIALGYNKYGKDSIYLKDHITINSLIPSTLYFEDFETPQSHTKYKVVNPDGDITWEIAKAPTSTNFNNSAFKLNSYLYPGIGQRDALISPTFDFTLIESAKLTFRFAYATKVGIKAFDSLIVYGSIDSGKTFPYALLGITGHSLSTTSVIWGPFTPNSNANWCSGAFSRCRSIVLDSFNGYKNVVFKFEYYDDNGNNLYIDDISIFAGCDGIITTKPSTGFVAANTTRCPGDTVKFSNFSMYGPRTYQWHFPGGTPDTSSQKNPEIIYNTPGIYDVTLIASNSLGSDTLTLKNYIRCVAPPNVIVGDTQKYVCPGDSVVFTASGTDSIQWYKHNLKQTVYGERMSDRPIQNTLYSVKAISPEGCYDSTAVTAIYVPLPPQPIIIPYPDSLMGHHLTGNFTYQWYLNDTLLPGKISKYYRPVKSGDYRVEIIDSAGCTSISASTYFTYTPKPSLSVNGLNNPGINIYPNPSQGIIHIEGDLQNAKFTLCNSLGQVVTEGRLSGRRSTIDVTPLLPGIYFLKISNSQVDMVKKVIRE